LVKITDITGFQGYLPVIKTRVSGNVIETREYITLNNKMNIKKIDKDHYMIIKTGEILECNKSKNRGESGRLQESKEKMMSIINENFTGGLDQALTTVTYRENMQDPKKLYNDFRYFICKVERLCKCDLSYIAVAEPQERGAWHLHILWKRLDGLRFFLSQKILMESWGHGGVCIKRLQDVDNVGAYLAGYLNKAIRSHWYPPGFNFYRCTQDLRRPVYEVKNQNDKSKYGSGYPVFERTYLIEDENGILQIVRYKQYNTLRKAVQTDMYFKSDC
jgi:hypothetical protein